MAVKNMLEIANFTCCFGGAPMLTLLKEVVVPAFTDMHLERRYKDNVFKLLNVSVGDFEIEKNKYNVIYGRLVQKRMLVSEQELIDGQIVKRTESLDDAPTSIFALIVDNHRLLLVGETQFAPGVRKFASTIRKFLGVKLRQFVVEYSKRQGITIEKSRNTLGELFLNIVPQPSKKEIDDFLDQYQIIQSIKINLIKKTNHERDAGLWEEELRNLTTPMQPNSVTVDVRKSSGIDSDSAKSYVRPVAEKAHSRIIVTGIAKNGQKITGDTTELRLRQPITISEVIEDTIGTMLMSFESAVNNELITLDTD